VSYSRTKSVIEWFAAVKNAVKHVTDSFVTVLSAKLMSQDFGGVERGYREGAVATSVRMFSRMTWTGTTYQKSGRSCQKTVCQVHADGNMNVRRGATSGTEALQYDGENRLTFRFGPGTSMRKRWQDALPRFCRGPARLHL
jgi:hypothetical protein